MIRSALAALLSLVAFAASAAPNVLLIIGDDHAAYVCGAYGNRQAKTPNIDRLAASGMRFDRAYCNSPVCTASRQSFLTGRLPHSIGVTQLQTPLPDAPVTLAELFKSAGYATAAVGKMHFNQKNRPGLHGFDELYDRPDAAAEVARRGAKPVDPAVAAQPPWRPFKDPARVWLNAANRPVARHIDDMPGSLFADRADAFLRAPRDKPFFLVASFLDPHSPYEYPLEYAGMFDPNDFDPPEPGLDDDAQIPDIFRGLTRAEKQGIAAAYYTSTAFLDRCVGRVLDSLLATGRDQDTVVVYLGDHGYSLGQHGRFEKHCMFEPAVRSPLIVRWPGETRPGSSFAGLVEFIDIYPTLAEICGLQPPNDIEGKSLVAALKGSAAPHRDFAFSVYAENEEAMICDARHKLVYGSGKRERKDGYATGRPLPGRTVRLYDRETDPDELRNLAADPAQADRVVRMKRAMLSRFGAAATPDAEIDGALDKLVRPPEEKLIP